MNEGAELDEAGAAGVRANAGREGGVKALASGFKAGPTFTFPDEETPVEEGVRVRLGPGANALFAAGAGGHVGAASLGTAVLAEDTDWLGRFAASKADDMFDFVRTVGSVGKAGVCADSEDDVCLGVGNTGAAAGA